MSQQKFPIVPATYLLFILTLSGLIMGAIGFNAAMSNTDGRIAGYFGEVVLWLTLFACIVSQPYRRMWLSVLSLSTVVAIGILILMKLTSPYAYYFWLLVMPTFSFAFLPGGIMAVHMALAAVPFWSIAIGFIMQSTRRAAGIGLLVAGYSLHIGICLRFLYSFN